jgi:hypothetical protein
MSRKCLILPKIGKFRSAIFLVTFLLLVRILSLILLQSQELYEQDLNSDKLRTTEGKALVFDEENEIRQNTPHNASAFHGNNILPEKIRPATLDLTPDEIKVTETLWHGKGESVPLHRSCHFPKMSGHLTSRCCIGATSAGSHQQFFGHSNTTCTQDITAYNRVRDLALHELNSSPIDGGNNDKICGPILLECDLCRIIQIVSSLKHKRISIVGDSLQRQLFNGLECELFRRGFNISEWRIDAWKDEPPSPKYSGWKYGVKGQQCFNVTAPDWMPDRETHSPQVEVCNFEHYRPYLHMEQHAKIAKISDIMVIDYGLHFLTDQTEEMVEYESSLNAMLNMFKNASDCHLIYRETSAQHFDREGGDFSYKADSFKSKKCVPHWGNSSLLVGVPARRKVLYNAARSQRYAVLDPYGKPLVSSVSKDMEHELTFLPFWNFTAKLSYLHASDSDCAHFCYTPHLWYTTWRHIRNTLDRLESKKKMSVTD